MNKKLITILSLLFIFVVVDNLSAIPAFARKYRMTCKTCHSPFPNLKDYGDEFAGNGFVLKDKDAPGYFVDTGDEELSLIRNLPLAVRLEGYLTYNNGDSEQPDFGAPFLMKLMSGGSIAKDLSYYFYFYFDERGEVAGVEDAYLFFNNLFGSELDFSVGQFQVSDPLFKRELRLTYDDYDIYKTHIGDSKATLAYDRGIMLSYGFETGTDVVVEIVNGSGLNDASPQRLFDEDKYKNYFGRISQNIGEHFRIGGFGYYGKEKLGSNTNELWMVGPDLTIAVEPFTLNVQYLERRDDNPLANVTLTEEVKTRGAFGELVLRPDGDDSKWYAVALYNYIDSDINSVDTKRGALHFGYLLKRNLRLVAEYSHDFELKFGRFGVGFVTAF